jgi:hypothetical protein
MRSDWNLFIKGVKTRFVAHPLANSEGPYIHYI